MERNKEIATSANLADSLTEQQCDVLEWASDMRHVTVSYTHLTLPTNSLV